MICIQKIAFLSFVVDCILLFVVVCLLLLFVMVARGLGEWRLERGCLLDREREI